MALQRIIVIGSSAGGLKALTTIVGKLPADLDAALFVVQHVSADHRSLLPEILSDIGALRARHPADHEVIEGGEIYVAPPDHHLLVDRGRVRVVHGPRENRQRPAVDTLFRSAARAYGARVVGVVLSGVLDDGTVGAQAVKRRGGVTVVQTPADAEFPGMPASALRYAPIDYELPAGEIADLLVRLVAAPVSGDAGIPPALAIEDDISRQELGGAGLLRRAEAIGRRSHYTCPECHGALWQIGDEEPLRFRCHVGHSFTAASLLLEQTLSLEGALWSAVRLMEEKADFLRRMAERRQRAQLPESAAAFADHAQRLESEIGILRRLIVEGIATRQLDKDAVPPPAGD